MLYFRGVCPAEAEFDADPPVRALTFAASPKGCVPHGRLRPNRDEICGHIETKKDHTTFPRVPRLPAYLLTAPHFSIRKDERVGE